MTVILALVGDTMLGRGVAERLRNVAPAELFANDLVAVARAADLMVCNLKCCISVRGEPCPDPAGTAHRGADERHSSAPCRWTAHNSLVCGPRPN